MGRRGGAFQSTLGGLGSAMRSGLVAALAAQKRPEHEERDGGVELELLDEVCRRGHQLLQLLQRQPARVPTIRVRARQELHDCRLHYRCHHDHHYRHDDDDHPSHRRTRSVNAQQCVAYCRVTWIALMLWPKLCGHGWRSKMRGTVGPDAERVCVLIEAAGGQGDGGTRVCAHRREQKKAREREEEIREIRQETASEREKDGEQEMRTGER
eukprot:2409731-Rhodomonas_salina.2